MKQLTINFKGNYPVSIPIMYLLKKGLKKVVKQREKRRKKGTQKDELKERLIIIDKQAPVHYGIIKISLIGKDSEINKEYNLLNKALLVTLEESMKSDQKLKNRILKILYSYGQKSFKRIKKVSKELLIRLYSSVAISVEYEINELEKLER